MERVKCGRNETVQPVLIAYGNPFLHRCHVGRDGSGVTHAHPEKGSGIIRIKRLQGLAQLRLPGGRLVVKSASQRGRPQNERHQAPYMRQVARLTGRELQKRAPQSRQGFFMNSAFQQERPGSQRFIVRPAENDVLFRVEISKEGTTGNADGRRNLINPRLLVPFLGEQIQSNVLDEPQDTGTLVHPTPHSFRSVPILQPGVNVTGMLTQPLMVPTEV
jgi:hypothetical protein